MDANQIEQKALRELQRGNTDKAAEFYHQLVKLNPRDKRVRSKLADLYLKGGRTKDADRQFRQLVKAYRHEGNHRAAIAILQRLEELNPKDPEIIGVLAQTYYSAGFKKEATPYYEKTYAMNIRGDVGKAIEAGEMILRLRPDDMDFRLKLAEALIKQKMIGKGLSYYRQAIDEYRHKGKMEEMGRLAKRALELRPDQTDLLRAAAEACLSVNDVPTALKHLQVAYANERENVEVVDLLAQAFEQGADPKKAVPILAELARLSEEQHKPELWLDALERAKGLGRPDLDADIERAGMAVQDARFRFHELPEAQPTDEKVLRPCVRAEVMSRYGFHADAAAELDKALRTLSSTPLLAWRAELAVHLDDNTRAVDLAKLLLEEVTDTNWRMAIAKRIVILGGETDLIQPEPEPEPEAEDEDDELVDDEEDDELVDDEATEPPTAPPAAAATDDSFDEVFNRGGTYAEVDPDDEVLDDEFTFGEKDEDPFGDDDDPFGDEEDEVADFRLLEAEALVAMGLVPAALELLADADTLETLTLKARCLAAEDPKGAWKMLKDASSMFRPGDRGYGDARVAMADIVAMAGKLKNARKELEKLRQQVPDHKPQQVAARLRALERLLP
jgi:predicted Zn-dependent protease